MSDESFVLFVVSGIGAYLTICIFLITRKNLDGKDGGFLKCWNAWNLSLTLGVLFAAFIS